MTVLGAAASAFRSNLKRVPDWLWPVLVAGVIFIVAYQAILAAFPEAEPRFRIDLSPVLTSSAALKIHLASVLVAFVCGIVLLAGVKGTRRHRILGWIWVIAMAATALSSFLLTGLNGGQFSIIHGLSAWVLVSLPLGVMAIRKGQVEKHRKHMTGMFLGGIIIAGLFTFLPGRTMWHIFFAA